MKKEQLFEAIGGLDEKMIAETEKPITKHSVRVLRRTLLVAALVAGLAVSAAAAPRFRNALKGGEVKKDDIAWFTPTNPADGTSHELRRYEITLEVELNTDAPETVEHFYAPKIPKGFGQYHGYFYKGREVQLGWIVEGTGRMIFFSQIAGGAMEENDLKVSVSAVPSDTPTAECRTFAGIEGYLTEEKTVGEDYGQRIFYWCDGDYLFRLELPCDYSDAQMDEMIRSVQMVEDITPYLVDMTQTEIKDVLG